MCNALPLRSLNRQQLGEDKERDRHARSQSDRSNDKLTQHSDHHCVTTTNVSPSHIFIIASYETQCTKSATPQPPSDGRQRLAAAILAGS